MKPASIANLTPMKAVTELRAQIDAFAARCAAERVRRGDDPEPLLDQFEAMQTAARDQDHARFFEVDLQLHLAIISLARVDGLQEAWQQVAKRMKAFHVETLRRCWPDLNALYEGHRQLVDAIAAGDARAAEEAARAHLEAVWYRLAEQTGDESLPDDPLARTTAYLTLHLDQSMPLSYLAQHVARVSEGHLARLFRDHFEQSFTEYLRELRLQKATERLLNTNQSIMQVAESVGYADPSRFSQHFGKRFNMTPRAYRKRFAPCVVQPD